MKPVVLAALLSIFLAAAISIAKAQETNDSSTSGSGPVAKLRADLKKAVENGHLTDAQKTTMQNAASALRQAAQARQNGEKVDRDSAKRAMSDIKQIVDSDAFRPEDKEVVKADLEAVKEKAKEARRGGRRGIFRR